MPLPSSVSWDSIRRAGFDARPRVPLGLLAAQGYVELLSAHRPLVVAGCCDRSAIMAAATSAARLHRRRYGGTWTEALSVTLTATRRAARLARACTAH